MNNLHKHTFPVFAPALVPVLVMALCVSIFAGSLGQALATQLAHFGAMDSHEMVCDQTAGKQYPFAVQQDCHQLQVGHQQHGAHADSLSKHHSCGDSADTNNCVATQVACATHCAVTLPVWYRPAAVVLDARGRLISAPAGKPESVVSAAPFKPPRTRLALS